MAWPQVPSSTTSVDGHYEIGKMGVGLLSFAVGVPPEDLIPRVEAYRKGQTECVKPKGLFRNERIATFTMAHCADTNDRAFAEAIVAASGGAARIAPETHSLADLAALFSCSRLYIGGDTGPMHVASLVGTPVVQILGPTDPIENAPFPGVPSRSVRIQIHCNPCRRGCAAVTCMRVIPPSSVIDAASELLATAEHRC